MHPPSAFWGFRSSTPAAIQAECAPLLRCSNERTSRSPPMSVHPAPADAANSAASPATRPAVTLPRLREALARGEKLAMLTCYDATFARVLDDAGADILLVGDSLGNVIQGETSTLPVTLEQMAYHTRCVAHGKRS